MQMSLKQIIRSHLEVAERSIHATEHYLIIKDQLPDQGVELPLYETRRSDEPLRTRLVELAREKPRFGYRRLHVLPGRSGEHVNYML
jgi:hypothetical protein